MSIFGVSHHADIHMEVFCLLFNVFFHVTHFYKWLQSPVVYIKQNIPVMMQGGDTSYFGVVRKSILRKNPPDMQSCPLRWPLLNKRADGSSFRPLFNAKNHPNKSIL